MKSVLLIEDDTDLRNSVAGLLRGRGFNVVCAENGMTGLELYLKRPADLVITDLSMPEMDGLSVITALLSRFPEAKIIAISGGPFRAYPRAYSDAYRDPLAAAMRLGAQVALPKPFTPKQLLDAIEIAISESACSYA